MDSNMRLLALVDRQPLYYRRDGETWPEYERRILIGAADEFDEAARGRAAEIFYLCGGDDGPVTF